MPAFNIFRKLIGRWKFTRLIDNSLTQESSIVEGIATFVPNSVTEDLLNYSEAGTWILPTQQRIDVSKEYAYKLNHQADSIDVYDAHAQKTLALLFSLGIKQTSGCSLGASSHHQCAKDSYNATISFVSEAFDTFSIRYDVVGPHKKYVSTTTYSRLLV